MQILFNMPGIMYLKYLHNRVTNFYLRPGQIIAMLDTRRKCFQEYKGVCLHFQYYVLPIVGNRYDYRIFENKTLILHRTYNLYKYKDRIISNYVVKKIINKVKLSYLINPEGGQKYMFLLIIIPNISIGNFY